MYLYSDLTVWKDAVEFVTKIYKVTESFPKSEVYGLTSQIRRSAVSIPSNIAEGASRKSSKEFSQFLSIAVGSLAELDTQLIIAKNLLYLDEQLYAELSLMLVGIRKMTLGLKRSIGGWEN